VQGSGAARPRRRATAGFAEGSLSAAGGGSIRGEPTRGARPPRLLRAALAAVALVLLGACHVDATVGVHVERGGGGSVTARFVFDADAVKQLGGLGKPVAEQPRAGDLARAGWKIAPVRTRKDGSAELSATKPFRDPAGFERAMAELSGPNGPLRNFRVRHRRGRWSTRTSVAGDVVLQGQETGITGDTQLEQRLRDQGIATFDLQAALQDAYAKYFTLRIAAQLPGHPSDNAPQHVGRQPVWTPKVGERIHLVATSTASNVRGPLTVALVVVFLALVAFAVIRVAVRPPR